MRTLVAVICAAAISFAVAGAADACSRKTDAAKTVTSKPDGQLHRMMMFRMQARCGKFTKPAPTSAPAAVTVAPVSVELEPATQGQNVSSTAVEVSTPALRASPSDGGGQVAPQGASQDVTAVGIQQIE
jgi:hypothetical protein